MTFRPAIEQARLPRVGAVAVSLGGLAIAVVRDGDGRIHAIDDTCSHDNISLSMSEVDGCTIECWLHGSRFDLETGRPISLPATRPLAVYPVRIDAGMVYVDADAPMTPAEVTGT